MYIRMLLLLGLSLLFTACSTDKYYGSNSLTFSDKSPKSMGVRYLLGRGVPQDNKKAFENFERAADQGDPFAQNELAYLYAAGKGTKRYYTKELFWYKKAAGHGLASAQYNLGLMYLHGLGTESNKKEAVEWFRQSAEHGFEPARNALSKYSSTAIVTPVSVS
jgi:TPR repeat protein